MGRVYAAPEAMLDHNVVVDPDRPAWLPMGKVVLQANAVDIGKFRRDGRQARLESSVMVSERP
jgi:hypothetical protein